MYPGYDNNKEEREGRTKGRRERKREGRREGGREGQRKEGRKKEKEITWISLTQQLTGAPMFTEIW
jgi:flagellar biosynthesis/type III secretory pathway protein FliH